MPASRKPRLTGLDPVTLGKGLGDIIREQTTREVARQLAPIRDRLTAVGMKEIVDVTAHDPQGRIRQFEKRRVFDMPDASADPPAAKLNYRGIWREGQTYAVNEGVTHDGKLWIAMRETTSRPATDTSWQLADKKGRAKP